MGIIKSYNGLYEQMFEDDNIREVIRRATKNKYKNNKRHRRLRYIKAHQEEYIEEVKNMIRNFSPPQHKAFEIYDGISAKKRKIIVPIVEEIFVHHAAALMIEKIVSKSFYEHSYASIPKRGTHAAVKTLKKWIQHDEKGTKYCLKLDIKKFFENIDQKILIERLNKIIRDKDFMKLIIQIIETVDKGIPLGFTTSQWFANFIMTELDHMIKEQFGAQHFLRFMDDIAIFGSNKRRLHKIKEQIEHYLQTKLHLIIKENWQLFLMDTTKGMKKGKFLDFLGYKFYRKHIGLRRRIALRAQRKAQHIFKKGGANIRDARQLVTYLGIVQYANCYKWFKTHIMKFANIDKLKKQISAYDKYKGGVEASG